ncbi:deoxynucleoside kinase [Candidatus Pacearchaeota archaeon]|nr:deoxynucleoside kinase [Candidatus Pacearchaeota archaeon]
MYKISIVGLDNTGKSSVVNALEKIEGIDTIRLSYHGDNVSGMSRFFARYVNRLVLFGEINNLKYFTGAAYFTYLFPYFFEQKVKKLSRVLISDRDPIIDTLCYFDFYLNSGLQMHAKKPLKFFLENLFSYPNSFIYFDITPEISNQRNNKFKQLHDGLIYLSRLKDLFDESMFNVEKKGIPVIRINVNSKSLEEITDEVRFYVKKSLENRSF